MTKSPRFLILALPRSGSNLLARLLNCHPDMCCDGEILLHADHAVAAQRVVAGVQNCANGGYGFVFRLAHVQRGVQPFSYYFVTEYASKGWQLIYLKRQNLLRQAVSMMIGMERSKWHFETAPTKRRYHIDCQTLLNTIRYLQLSNIAYDHLAATYNPLHLTYETDLLPKPRHQQTANRCFAHLNLPAAPVHSSLVRASTERLADSIQNYDEVVASVLAQGYGKHLD